MLISVYMPTRNRVGLLQNAVESVLGQTHRNLEFIVVDDASTDGTEAYLQATAKRDPRFIYIKNATALGAPASRNIAIRKSSGVFVTGLDDDDQFHPHRLETFLDYWNLLSAAGIRPACLYAQDIWLKNGAQFRTTRKQSSVSVRELFEYNYIGNQIFAPRAHFIEAGLFDEGLPAWQDMELFMRVLQTFGSAHLLDMPTYLFDATERPDRISLQEKKIRHAFAMVAEKHASYDPARRRTLFLQMFQEGYTIAPKATDWAWFLRSGHFPKGFLRMMRATLAHHKRARKERVVKTGLQGREMSIAGD
jgi:glycosyltransferase involved in cell wall biosynthesis